MDQEDIVEDEEEEEFDILSDGEPADPVEREADWQWSLENWPRMPMERLYDDFRPDDYREGAVRVWAELRQEMVGMVYERYGDVYIVTDVEETEFNNQPDGANIKSRNVVTDERIAFWISLREVLSQETQIAGHTCGDIVQSRRDDRKKFADYNPMSDGSKKLLPESPLLSMALVGPYTVDTYTVDALRKLLKDITFTMQPNRYNCIIRAVYHHYRKYYLEMSLKTYDYGLVHFFSDRAPPLREACTNPADAMPFITNLPRFYHLRELYETQGAFRAGTHGRLGQDSSILRATNSTLGQQAMIELMHQIEGIADIALSDTVRDRAAYERRRREELAKAAENERKMAAAVPPLQPTRTQKVTMRKIDGAKTYFRQTIDEYGRVVDETQLSGPPHISTFPSHIQREYDIQQERLRRGGTLYHAPVKRKSALPLDDEEKSHDLLTRPPSTQRRRGPEGKRPVS
jgi:hypothetical protein